MKHRQGPQIDRVTVEPKGDRVADRVQKRATVMVDDALGIAGCAGGVIERYRLPFVMRPRPGGMGLALAKKRLVFGAAQRNSDAVIDFDEGYRATKIVQGWFDNC